MENNVELSNDELTSFLAILQARFGQAMHRHPAIIWSEVEARLRSQSKKVHALYLMEESGGEPDVVMRDPITNEFVFFDCSKESPVKRRNSCYDEEAKESRKVYKPAFSAKGYAKLWGVKLLTEEEYRYLQTLENVDLKTSSWIETPDNIRSLGGALFGDCRYNHTFIYHNGAQSYYGVRGFRCSLRV
ncbi:MAG: DUF4256 domain-containing protein [Candidatus Izemoplasmatales bacterium]|nr:DUF4256 domain-containing protein [bacterium]MDZ4196843.1 DUF4256 domain-containing protein [Candidatus Izemoplasmatales bacterium]